MGAVGTTPEVGSAVQVPVVDGAFYRPSPSAATHHQKKKRLRSLTRPLPPRPPRASLERACRIALMEAETPASVEAIYDRIVRRGSLQFFRYKRPFRMIELAMSALVKRGEAMLVVAGRSRPRNSMRDRLWCRTVGVGQPKRIAYTCG
jgi:hypothetical protein